MEWLRVRQGGARTRASPEAPASLRWPFSHSCSLFVVTLTAAQPFLQPICSYPDGRLAIPAAYLQLPDCSFSHLSSLSLTVAQPFLQPISNLPGGRLDTYITGLKNPLSYWHCQYSIAQITVNTVPAICTSTPLPSVNNATASHPSFALQSDNIFSTVSSNISVPVY